MDGAAENPITWRFAGPDDLDALVALLGILFEQEADFAPDAAKQRRALEMILRSPDSGRLFCVESAGMVVGMAGLLFVPDTMAGGLAGWLEDVVVLPEWRGRGIGRILLQGVIQTACDEGCRRVMLLTDRDNARARRIYGAMGFAALPGMAPMRKML